MGVYQSSERKSWGVVFIPRRCPLCGALPTNPDEMQTPLRREKQDLYGKETNIKQRLIVQKTNETCWKGHTAVTISSNVPCDTLCIESMAHDNLETRYPKMNITFQCLLQRLDQKVLCCTGGVQDDGMNGAERALLFLLNLNITIDVHFSTSSLRISDKKTDT